MFTARDMEQHARYRRLLSGPMSESSLKSVEHIVRARVDLAIERMAEEMKKRGAADVMKWWQFFSTDVIGELTFGESFRMLEIGKVSCFCLTSCHRSPVLLERPIYNLPFDIWLTFGCRCRKISM